MLRLCVAATLAVLVSIVAVEPSRSVRAQEASPCARIADAAERLACYDRALPPVTKAEPPAAEAAPALPEQEPEPEAPRPREATLPQARPAEAETARPSESMPIVVIGMRKLPGRSASFTTESGDVWIQIGAESLYVPKVPFEAELRPASMGTYFLRPSDYGWRVHVRRND